MAGKGFWNAKRVVRGRAHDTQTLTAFKYAHDTRGMCFGNSVSGNSSEIRDCVRGEKMPYELQGGERRRKALKKKSGDFSTKSSNKAQRAIKDMKGTLIEKGGLKEALRRSKAILDTKGTLIDERPFSMRKAFQGGERNAGRGTQRA